MSTKRPTTVPAPRASGTSQPPKRPEFARCQSKLADAMCAAANDLYRRAGIRYNSLADKSLVLGRQALDEYCTIQILSCQTAMADSNIGAGCKCNDVLRRIGCGDPLSRDDVKSILPMFCAQKNKNLNGLAHSNVCNTIDCPLSWNNIPEDVLLGLARIVTPIGIGMEEVNGRRTTDEKGCKSAYTSALFGACPISFWALPKKIRRRRMEMVLEDYFESIKSDDYRLASIMGFGNGLPTLEKTVRYDEHEGVHDLKMRTQQQLDDLSAFSLEELRKANYRRGMRWLDGDKEALKTQLRDWVTLSVCDDAPLHALLYARPTARSVEESLQSLPDISSRRRLLQIDNPPVGLRDKLHSRYCKDVGPASIIDYPTSHE